MDYNSSRNFIPKLDIGNYVIGSFDVYEERAKEIGRMFLKNKGKNRMIGELSGKIVDLDLKEAMNNKNSNNADDKEVEQFINSL